MLRSLSASVVALALAMVAVEGQGTDTPPRISYGQESTSVGELLVPPGTGPFPVAILLHGGCWLSKGGGAASMRPMARMLADHGIASWNVEYRRVGHAGGGWPGTFTDLSDATDFLDELAKSHPIDLRRVVTVGHSSGGYFAAWLGGRQYLPADSALGGRRRVKVSGMVLLDAFLDPLVIDSKGVNGEYYCGEPVLERLAGGAPDAVPDHMRQISPLALLPYGVPQEYVVSSRRYPVTPPRPSLADGRTTFAVKDYPALARAAGDTVNVQIVPDADHFDFTKPGTPAWKAVEAALVRIFPSR